MNLRKLIFVIFSLAMLLGVHTDNGAQQRTAQLGKHDLERIARETTEQD